MTDRTSRIRKYILFFLEICTFWKNGNFVENVLGKKFIFLAILTFLMPPLDAQQNFMLTTYVLFLSISVRSKVITFFLQNLPKVNILSVIAVD